MIKISKIVGILLLMSISVFGAIVEISVDYPKTRFNINVQEALEQKIEKCVLYDENDVNKAEGINEINLKLSKGSYQLRLVCNGTTRNGQSNEIFGSQLTTVTVETGSRTTANFDLYPTAKKTVTYTINSDDVISNGEYKFIFRDGTSVTRTLTDKSITFDIEDHNPLTQIDSVSDVKIGNIIYSEPFLFTLYTENDFTVDLADIPVDLTAGVSSGTAVIYTTGIIEDDPVGETQPLNLVIQVGNYTFSAKKEDGTVVDVSGYLVRDGLTTPITNGVQFNLDSTLGNLSIVVEYPENTQESVILKFETETIPEF